MKKVTGRFVYNWIYAILIILCMFSIVFSHQLEIFLMLKPKYYRSNSTEIHFIDVGQGDAIAIKFPNDEIMLVDTGTKNYLNKLTYYIDNILNTDRIDYFVLTHTDSDHSSNVIDILNKYEIGTFYRPNIYEVYEEKSPYINNENYRNILKTLKNKNINIKFNTEDEFLEINNVTVDWLCPLDDLNIENFSSNEQSCVLVINDNNNKVMLTGDISKKIETRLINNYDNELLDIDVLKLAHHGSSGSTTEEFLNTVSPKIAVVSVGENTYGHPSNETLDRIVTYDENNNTNLINNLYSTKDLGNIIVTLDESLGVTTIQNIDDYVFIPYYVYANIGILIILVFMIRPYVIVGLKNLRFIIQNRNWKKNRDKELLELKNKKSSENVKEI